MLKHWDTERTGIFIFTYSHYIASVALCPCV